MPHITEKFNVEMPSRRDGFWGSKMVSGLPLSPTISAARFFFSYLLFFILPDGPDPLTWKKVAAGNIIISD